MDTAYRSGRRRPAVGALGRWLCDAGRTILGWRGRLGYVRLSPLVVVALCLAASAAAAWIGDARLRHLALERQLALSDAALAAAEAGLAETRRRLGEQVRLTEQVLGRRLVVTEQRLAADLRRAHGTLAELAAWRRASVARAEERLARIAELEFRLAESVAANAALEARLDGLAASKAQLIERVNRATRQDIEHAARVFEATGLDAEEIAAGGQGGPFVPLDGRAGRGPLEALDTQLERWSRMRRALRVLPLAAPLGEFAVSGRFGQRRDPLNGRWAMHWGLDLIAPPRSPIRAAGSGAVVYAGWLGGYGRTIDIDHGAGIRTRYAHLRAITVKRGQIVAAGEPIGLLGSSGRTTGAHLHYEVTVGGERVDPARFLKAGRLVGEAEGARLQP